MSHRHGQLDVPHTLPPNTCLCHLHTAAVTNHAPVLDAFILPAGAFPILNWPEDSLAKKTSFFWLKSTVIDGLGILDFTLGPRTNGFWRSHRYGDMIHMVNFVQAKQLS